MSMNTNPAQTYRRLAGQGTTKVGLVVQCYDQIVNSLYAGARAIEARDIEKKTDDLNHALLVVSYLHNALDFDAGPKVARDLEQFYNVMRSEVLRASVAASPETLREVAGYFMSMREAWQEVEQATRDSFPTLTSQPSPPSPPPPVEPSADSGARGWRA